MSTYTYTCRECNTTFSLEATLQEKEARNSGKFICPKCQSKNITPAFSVTNFIKNIFQSDTKVVNCCSGGGSCGTTTEKKGCCGGKKDHDGCCTSKK